MADRPAKNDRPTDTIISGLDRTLNSSGKLNGHSSHPWRVPHARHAIRPDHNHDTLKNTLSKYLLELANETDPDAPACLRCNYAPGITTYCAMCFSERKSTGEVANAPEPWHNGPRSTGYKLMAGFKSMGWD